MLHQCHLERGWVLTCDWCFNATPHPLNSPQPSTPQPFTAPGGCQRLFDLVTPNKAAYTPAFFFGLRNTLVTKDLDHATKVGVRVRVLVRAGRGDF